MARNSAAKGGKTQRRLGDNSLTEAETKQTNTALKELVAIKLAKAAFNTKMRNRANKAKSPLRDMGMDMGEVDAYVDSLIVEQGKDDDAAEKAANKRAKKLDTHRRLHAATHDGEQLDWLTLAERAEKARATEDDAVVSQTSAKDEDDEEDGE